MPSLPMSSIEGDVGINTVVKIFDIEGRLLFTENISSNKIIDLYKLYLTDGIYIAELQEGNQFYRTRIVKTSY